MPIAILTDLFLLNQERTSYDGDNHYNKYKEDLRQSEQHKKINDNIKSNKHNKNNEHNENKCCRRCKLF